MLYQFFGFVVEFKDCDLINRSANIAQLNAYRMNHGANTALKAEW